MGKLIILITVICLGVATTQAEVIKIPIGSQAQAEKNIDRPQRGLSKEMVEARFGAPQGMIDAVGDPPISSWNYATYVVFFEYDLVLHTVLKHVAVVEQPEAE
jgi:hypothetical protein